MKLMHVVNMLQSGRGYNFFHSDEGGACVKTGFLCSVSMLNDVHLCSNCFVYIVVVYVPSQSLTLTAYMSFRSCGRANFRKLEEYEFIDFVADKVPELQARAVSKPVWVQ